eukprot:gene355-6769_t
MEKIAEKKTIVKEFLEDKEKIDSTHEGIVLFLHLNMINCNFRLVGLSEKEDIKELEKIPKDWNKNKDAYVFKYKHVQSSLTFILKMIPLSSSLIVHAIASEDSKSKANIDININDYLGIGKNIEEKDTYYSKLDTLEQVFKKEIILKLIPMNSKEEKKETQQETQQIYQDDYNPLRISRNNQSNNFVSPNFGNVGSNDLYPQFPPMPGTSGFTINPNQGGFGGSQVGPDSNLFQRRFRPGMNQNIPSNVPFGARFDPFGPTPNTNYGDPNPNHQRMPQFNEDDDDQGENPFFL